MVVPPQKKTEMMIEKGKFPQNIVHCLLNTFAVTSILNVMIAISSPKIESDSC